MEYVPFAALVAEPLTTFDCKASTRAPLIAVPLLLRVMDPEIVPGGGVPTVKVTPLLGMGLVVTTTGPVVAPVGTGATITVLPQVLGVAVTPLKVTLLRFWLAPKFEPLIVTAVPTCPTVGERVVITGGGGTGMLTLESSAPFSVRPMSISPLTLVLPELVVTLTPTQR